MKPNLKLVEARGDDVTFTFGRFNPPTIGHEKLMDATQKLGRNYRVYASHTQDANKNPLDYCRWQRAIAAGKGIRIPSPSHLAPESIQGFEVLNKDPTSSPDLRRRGMIINICTH